MPMAVAMIGPGGPEKLQTIDVPLADPGPGEVRLRQSVIGVNFVDIYFRTGLYPVAGLPAVLGVEGAGTVEAVGDGVAELRPGDRVAYAGMPLGAYAECRTLPATRLVKLPEGVSERAAGSTMARGLTAHMLLRKVYPVQSGDWVLVHAAAGGLGQIVSRWAKHLGAQVIGIVGSPGKIETARAAGADHVLLRNATWPDDVRRLADGKGVHLAVDGIGGDVLAQTLSVVRPFGTVASLGQPAGPIPPVNVEELGPARSIALMRPSVIGYANDPTLYRPAAAELLTVMQDWLVNPIGAEYALSDAAKAQAALEAGRTTGSVILTV
jgi:NADPH2:quinone reductase